MAVSPFLKPALLVAAVVLWTCAASALSLNLTTPGASGWINGAYFQQVDPQSTGTGTINSFVQITGAGVTHAYNTTADALDNGSTAEFNHELALSDLRMVMIDTQTYYEFLLDINQTNADPYLSLDDVQLFASSVMNQNVATFDSNGVLELGSASLLYRLDAGNADNWIALDYSLNAGSGSGDMLFYVPTAVFADVTGSHVYLYSRFGENYAGNDGFEEWCIILGGDEDPEVIPEPASLVLVALGLLGIFRFKSQAL